MKDVFEGRIAHFSVLLKSARKKGNYIAMVRLAIFIFFAAAIILGINQNLNLLAGLSAISLVFSFGLLVKWHNRVRYTIDYYNELITINGNEIERLELRLKDFKSGAIYEDPIHPYSGDLDLFGSHSLFQFVNRTGTELGELKLVSWLKENADFETIRARQQSVEELKRQLDWRQELEAKSRLINDEKGTHSQLVNWIKREEGFLADGSRLLTIILAFIPGILIVAYLLSYISSWPVLLAMLANGMLFRRKMALLLEIKQNSNSKIKMLRAYRELFNLIEQNSFKSAFLVDSQSKLKHTSLGASGEIKRLFDILNYIDYTNNALFGIIANGLFNWDLLWGMRLDRWKQEQNLYVKNWFDALAAFEVMGSIAAVAYAQDNWHYPQQLEGNFGIAGKSIGHPLISKTERVSNDYELTGKGVVHILTGSNMSGKSTFQRTIGINCILANIGAPVCANEFKMSEIHVFTSMRLKDSLEESTSSFYAELKRIKQLIELAKEDDNVFFFLDEILKGTNSNDRHHGAKGLVKQLIEMKASGIVSTHDLELSELALELPNQVSNYSFTSEISGNDIKFDYKIKHGPCKSFNASKLMELMGIWVDK